MRRALRPVGTPAPAVFSCHAIARLWLLRKACWMGSRRALATARTFQTRSADRTQEMPSPDPARWLLSPLRIACMLAVLCLGTASVAAQPLTLADTPWHRSSEALAAHQEIFPAYRPGLWRAASNPAGLSAAAFPVQGWAQFSAGDIGGPLQRPQHPEGLQFARLNAAGAATINDWHSYGAFSFTRREDRRVAWSAVEDPHDRMAYVWADSIGGAWYRNHVEMAGALGSPQFLGRMPGGIRVYYRVGQGARRNDPRPQYRSRTVGLLPGLSIDLSASHTMGVHAVLRWELEENDFGLFTTDDPFVYRLRGFGTFDRTQIVRGTRTTSGARVGGGAQYAFSGARWQADLSGRYVAGVDSVRDGIRAPAFGGRHAVQEASLRGALLHDRERHSARLQIDAGWWEGRGTDPVFQAVNLISENAYIHATTELWSGNNRASSAWGVALILRADEVSRRDVVSQTAWNVTSLRTGIGGWLQRPLSDHFQLHLRPAIMRYAPLREDYQARNPSHLTGELVAPDHAFHQHARWAGQLRVAVGWRPADQTEERLRVSLDGAYSRTAPAAGIGERYALWLTLTLLSSAS